MLTVDLRDTNFSLFLTLGAVDTEDPPPLILAFERDGTNDLFKIVPSALQVIPGTSGVTVIGLDTVAFPRSGQYNFEVFDNTVPLLPVKIQGGLLEAITDPITIKEYGTDKIRGEYKGYNI